MRLWLAETIRLREAHWGLLDDSQAVRMARQGPPDLTERLLLRAAELARPERLAQHLQQWRQGGWWAVVVLALLAVLAGGGAGLGALGDGARPVNVVWALAALLGLHALTYLFWLASLMWPQASSPHGLGALWLWMMRRMARGPHAALIPSAFVNLLAQARMRRSLYGAISHLLWSLFLGAALITMVFMLSTAQYQFVWATTLLSPERFVALTQTLGAVPAWLGFPMPDEALVRASDGATVLPAIAQTQWSLWLLGVVTVFGLLPRLLALAWCGWRLDRARRGIRLDTSLPGFIELRERLLPTEQALGIDRPVQALHTPRLATPAQPLISAGQPAIVALEPDPDATWPPFDLTGNTVDLGCLDTREQRQIVLEALARQPAQRLLVVCDANQTPDRGALSVLSELATHAVAIGVLLDAGMRREQWLTQLASTGFAPETIFATSQQARQWLGADT